MCDPDPPPRTTAFVLTAVWRVGYLHICLAPVFLGGRKMLPKATPPSGGSSHLITCCHHNKTTLSPLWDISELQVIPAGFPTGSNEGFVCSSTALPVQACFLHSLNKYWFWELSPITGLYANLCLKVFFLGNLNCDRVETILHALSLTLSIHCLPA